MLFLIFKGRVRSHNAPQFNNFHSITNYQPLISHKSNDSLTDTDTSGSLCLGDGEDHHVGVGRGYLQSSF